MYDKLTVVNAVTQTIKLTIAMRGSQITGSMNEGERPWNVRRRVAGELIHQPSGGVNKINQKGNNQAVTERLKLKWLYYGGSLREQKKTKKRKIKS